jgi:hypothetical protein
MATRSRIAVENQDGTVESIYCHFDGYIEHNGKLLANHYTDSSKVRQLIDLGDISFLAENVVSTDDTHSFETPTPGVVVAYHRDRGETYYKPTKESSKEVFFDSGSIEEYGYLFTREGEWMVKAEATGSIYKLDQLLKTKEDA